MAMKTKMLLLSGLGLSLIVGCSSSVSTGSGGAGGSGGGPDTTSSATTGSTSASTGGGTCPGFEDASGIDSVTIRFINKGDSPVYLPVGCENIGFKIDPITGPDGVTYNYEEACLQTCEELQTSPQYVCGACAPKSYRLDAGAKREVTWKGVGLKPEIMMPAACWESQLSGNSSCSQVVAAAADTYRITAFGYSMCGQDCTCDAQGVCNGTAEGTQAFANPVKFAFPADDVAEVVFDTCAFGCPDGP